MYEVFNHRLQDVNACIKYSYDVCAAISDRKPYHLGNCINKSNVLDAVFKLYIANFEVSGIGANDKMQRLASIYTIL